MPCAVSMYQRQQAHSSVTHSFLVTVTQCTRNCVLTSPSLPGPTQSTANWTNSSQSIPNITGWKSLGLIYTFVSCLWPIYFGTYILFDTKWNVYILLWRHLNFTSQCLVLNNDSVDQAPAVCSPNRPAWASFQLSAVDQLWHHGKERGEVNLTVLDRTWVGQLTVSEINLSYWACVKFQIHSVN